MIPKSLTEAKTNGICSLVEKYLDPKQPRPFPAAEAPIADMPSLPALVKAAAAVFLPSPLSTTLLYCASLAPASESQTPWTGI